jgi:hypothetical protein
MPVMKSTTSVRTTVYDLSTTTISSEDAVSSSVETISDSRLETVHESTDNADDEAAACDKRPSVCSLEITRVLSENRCTRNLTALVDQTRPESPVPSESADEFSTFEYNKQTAKGAAAELVFDRPRSVRSISPAQRPATPGQVIVFPPPLPECFQQKARAASPASPRPPTVVEEPKPQAGAEERPITLQNSPPLKFEPGIITTLLTTAPTRPFTPIEPAKATIFTEDVPLPQETTPYLPETDVAGRRTPRAPSPLVTALTVCTERAYSPLPTSTDYHEFAAAPQETCPTPARPSMAAALAVAPVGDERRVDADEKAPPDLSEDPSLILTRPCLDPVFKKKDPPTTYYSSLYSRDAFFPPITEELKAKFEEKKKKTSWYSSKRSIERSSPAGSLFECSRTTAITAESTPAQRRPLVTETGLHKAVTLPHYQHCVKELAAKNPVKKTPSSSRRSTPMHSDRPTPISFDATVVSTQQRTFNTDVTKKLETTSRRSSFLSHTTDISEKVTPALGYQPCPLVERASFEKIEKCVQNIREGRIMERSSRPSSVVSNACSESGSVPPEKPKRRNRRSLSLWYPFELAPQAGAVTYNH